MNWADWFILAVIALSAVISIKRGFIKEALSLVAWVAAFVVARIFSFKLAVLLEPYIELYSLRIATAFVLLFILTLVVGALINHLLSLLVAATGLSGTDRMLGMVFGIARGCLLIVVTLALLKNTPLASDPWWMESSLVPRFLVFEEWSFDLFKQISDYLLQVGS